MRIEKRWNRSKSSYVYSFVYYDNKTKGRRRISQKEIIKRYGHRITDKRDALKIKRELEEDIDTERKRRDRRKGWQKLYHDQKKCLALYEKHMIANKFSERSRASRLSYLNYYVFHFFLNIKKCDRIDDWPIYYDEFRLWLEYEARTYREPKRILTYQTKDHCITALNCLMKFLRQKDMVLTAAICSMFGSRFYNSLGVDHLVSEVEFNSVFEELKTIDSVVAAFYRFTYFTGCRFNEAIGLNLKNLFEGRIPSKLIEESLTEHGKTCYGYVHIDSQPENKLIRDPESKLVPRKPLKGRVRIDDKSARLIPIVDKQLWDGLLILFEKQTALFDKKTYGEKEEDYLLFDGITYAIATHRLKKAYKKSKLKYKPWHCLRHTRCTEIIGTHKNYLLARVWLGHRSLEVQNRYNHLHEQVVRGSKTSALINKVRTQSKR